MKGRSLYKAPGEKLIKVSLEYDRAIKKIRITGDFFVHPEEAIDRLEKELAGVEVDKTILEEKISSFLRRMGAESFGITPGSLAKAIVMCRDEDGGDKKQREQVTAGGA